MLSLFRDSKDEITIDDKTYAIDCNFNVVLANLELSQNKEISDYVKARVTLKNYLNVSDDLLNQWGYLRQVAIYVEICEQLFKSSNNSKSNSNKTDDKSVYSFSEDADFIFSSFLKEYNINLIEQRNKMHWNEFKALFLSLGKDTKIVEVMAIRSWKQTKDDSKERIAEMKKLQSIYALQTTQVELEELELERKKMALMTTEERLIYAKSKLREGG